MPFQHTELMSDKNIAADSPFVIDDHRKTLQVKVTLGNPVTNKCFSRPVLLQVDTGCSANAISIAYEAHLDKLKSPAAISLEELQVQIAEQLKQSSLSTTNSLLSILDPASIGKPPPLGARLLPFPKDSPACPDLVDISVTVDLTSCWVPAEESNVGTFVLGKVLPGAVSLPASSDTTGDDVPVLVDASLPML